MKKVIFIFVSVLLFSVSLQAGWIDGTCNGAGRIYEAKDGRKYCVATEHRVARLNWWSAILWCRKMGSELMDVNKDCNLTSDNDIICHNFEGLANMGAFWTKNVRSKEYGTAIMFQNPPKAQITTTSYARTYGLFAICPMK